MAVIGAGRNGRDFAVACARAGYRVVLEDVMPSKLRDAELLLPDDVTMEFAGTVEDAVREADFAIDFVPDELESKLEMVCMIDRMAPPKTVIIIRTDALDVDDLARCTYRADRCVGATGGRVLQAEQTSAETWSEVSTFRIAISSSQIF